MKQNENGRLAFLLRRVVIFCSVVRPFACNAGGSMRQARLGGATLE